MNSLFAHAVPAANASPTSHPVPGLAPELRGGAGRVDPAADAGSACWIALLAERLAIHLSQEVWQRLFHGTGRCGIGFTETPVAVLYVDGTGAIGRHDEVPATLDRLAGWHGGLVDPFTWGGSLVFFAQVEGAVRTAVALQRAVAEGPLRMGVHCGQGLVARFRVSGAAHATLLGPAADRAQALAAAAACGSVSLSLAAHAAWNSARFEAGRTDAGCVSGSDAVSGDPAGASALSAAHGPWRCEPDGNGSMRLVPTARPASAR